VAERAGVGMSALYRRYRSKEELLARLAGDGLRRYITEAEAARADDGEPWGGFRGFMGRIVAAGAQEELFDMLMRERARIFQHDRVAASRVDMPQQQQRADEQPR